jgi:hypothetical protein
VRVRLDGVNDQPLAGLVDGADDFGIEGQLARLRVVDPFRDRSVVADGVVVPLACHVRVGGAQLPDDRSQPPVEGAPRCFAARSD